VLTLDNFRGRFLFGTDALAPKDRTAYFDTYNKDAPLWPLLTNEASLKSRNETYKRIFDEARPKVRAWEVLISSERSRYSQCSRLGSGARRRLEDDLGAPN